MIKKYKLVNKETNEVLTLSDNNNLVFGGKWGRLQAEGKIEWMENTPSQEELDNEHNSPILRQIEELEGNQLRKLREIMLDKYNSMKSERLSELLDIDNQIENLRNQLR